ncbi:MULTISPECIES: class I SAM-dependent methyltransferase [Citricoccus]|uniref:class I SAM-dependent methyltransferase n=1 Tax=Citricoccus TaxID=169133 RepID=UPI000255E080|nr:class I SAM-dependent methyltransferase [Citricoccus sp. CH26A]
MSPVPPRPTAGPRLTETARLHQGEAFRSTGRRYDAIRPSYPAGVVDFLVPAGARTAVDLGAGTGLFTALLDAHGLAVTAVDPSAAMLEVLRAALPRVRTVQAGGERTGLPDGCADVVTAAQAWHWIDPEAGAQEAARLLGRGVLGIVSNQLDTTVPWVHRLSRIMHAGDVHPPRQPPAVGERFTAPEGRWWHWTQPITPEGLHDLMATRSYHLRATDAVRDRMRANLDWYLLEHLGHAPGEMLELPYVTSAWRCEVRPLC